MKTFSWNFIHNNIACKVYICIIVGNCIPFIQVPIFRDFFATCQEHNMRKTISLFFHFMIYNYRYRTLKKIRCAGIWQRWAVYLLLGWWKCPTNVHVKLNKWNVPRTHNTNNLTLQKSIVKMYIHETFIKCLKVFCIARYWHKIVFQVDVYEHFKTC